MITDWRKFNLEAWRRLDPEFRVRAVRRIRENVPEGVQIQVRDLADKDPEWLADYHFMWGMWLRNMLRQGDLSDDQLPLYNGGRNWDDYYGACVEVAVKGGIWHDLKTEERA